MAFNKNDEFYRDSTQIEDDELEQNRFREAMDPVIPTNYKSLRCCLICGLIKSQEQFEREGCDNCKRIFGDTKEYITPSFSGMLSLLRPDRSYISKVIGMKDDYVCGLYAATCDGNVPPQIESAAAANDIQLFCLR